MRTGPHPSAWGLQREYVDVTGVRRRVTASATRRVLGAMGATTDGPALLNGPVFAQPGTRLPRGAVRVIMEDGGEAEVSGIVPPSTPHGYHRVVMRDGGTRPLIVSPRRCVLPPHERAWGWSAQLYALRSKASWGIGDLADLRRLSRWSQRLGAQVLVVNPLHAALPGAPQEASPYYPSSRMFRNPVYLDITGLTGVAGALDAAGCAREAAALNREPLINRERVYALKLRALSSAWGSFTGHRRFDAYRAREGELLQRYAGFCAISERHGRPWTAWPEALRRPDSNAVARFARSHADRVAFHAFVQWQLDEQVRRASRGISIVNDLAVGFSPDGADAWLWQDLLARGVTIGAPPDLFAPHGQDWSVPPFDPHRLRAAGYAPIIETLRRAMRHSGGLRIDHVMGFFRLWWVPAGSEGPAGGAYVRLPASELLDILALESARSGCFVVGEDLGTVGSEVRAELHRRAVLSYRVAWFEPRSPGRYPVQALAALSTHDLPTAAGLWTGADLEDLRRSGREPVVDEEARVRRRLRRLSGCSETATSELVVERAHLALGRAPCLLVTASLDDAALATARPNLPGAAARPNWCLPLPLTLEQLRRARLPRRIAAALRR